MEYEEILRGLPSHRPLVVDVLVLPGTSLLSFASTIDPMRAANRLAGRSLFAWRALSQGTEAPLSSADLPLPVAGLLDPAAPRDLFCVMAGFGASKRRDRDLLRLIYRASRSAALTLGVESGAWLLAHAGLLDGRRATTHWEDLEDFAAAYPLVEVKPSRFVTDGAYLTTSAAAPTFELMIDLLRKRGGQALALKTAGVFNYPVAHRPDEQQSEIPLAPSGRFDRRIVRAIRVMQDRIDSPRAIAEIAREAGLSLRGFELLFRREIDQTPGQFYLSLRLGAARKLLLDTSLPIVEIAARVGFSSVATFSRAYRRAYDTAPSRDRRRASGRRSG